MARFRVRLAFLAVATLLFMSSVFSFAFADQADAASAIASAKQEIVASFEAAKRAEGFGADISGLTGVLNDAGLLLSDAELAFSKGDFDAAWKLAVQCRERLVDFVPEVNSLAMAAAESSTRDFVTNVVGSIAGVFVVVAVGILMWSVIRNRYAKVGGL